MPAISYKMWGFGNETVKGFSLVKNALECPRLAKCILCATLNLTDGSCITVIPGITDN